MSETNETGRVDLSYLSDVQPKETSFRALRRGRQPGHNPVAEHVKRSAANDVTLSLPVRAEHARQTERLLRRAATRYEYTISVQVLTADPDTADADDVIALRELPNLPADTDVWVSFKASAKTEAEKASENESADETPKTDLEPVADPFAGQPTADAETASEEDESEDETPKGRRAGRRSKASA